MQQAGLWSCTTGLIMGVALQSGALAGSPKNPPPTPEIQSRVVTIEHVKIKSAKSFDAVKAALEASVPRFDHAMLTLLEQGKDAEARHAMERGPDLAIFLTRDHGALLRIAGQSHKALQYEIGNPLTASRMTRYRLAAALYAPLRVLLYEDDSGHATFEFDSPTTTFGQFADPHVDEVARGLDAKLRHVLMQAAQ